MINFFFRLKNRKVNKNAFTIAEMLISIAIIGILVSISVPNMRKWVEKERQNAYLRELISYLELVKKETRRWNGRCTLQTNTRLRNSIDPVTSKHIGFKAFNVNCYDMNDSEIKNIQSRVPLIEHKVFQEVNMQTFNFTPRGNLAYLAICLAEDSIHFKSLANPAPNPLVFVGVLTEINIISA